VYREDGTLADEKRSFDGKVIERIVADYHKIVVIHKIIPIMGLL
jgi:hypothetical protein